MSRWGFRLSNVEIHGHSCHQDSRFSESRFLDVTLLLGPFPKASIAAMRPLEMDGPDRLSQFRDF